MDIAAMMQTLVRGVSVTRSVRPSPPWGQVASLGLELDHFDGWPNAWLARTSAIFLVNQLPQVRHGHSSVTGG
jgi:hypothetical protein